MTSPPPVWRPRWWRTVTLRLRSLVLRRRVERELDDELAFHMEMAEGAARARGLDADAARLAARRGIDGLALRKDECRDARGWARLDALLQDVRHAARGLRRTPIYTVVAIVSLGLGLGATSTLFALVDAVLLKPLPVPAPDRLVWIAETREGEESGGSPARLQDWAALEVVRAAGGFYGDQPYVRTSHGDLGRLSTLRSFGPLLQVVALQPIAGRLPTAAEERADGAAVALITEGAWRRLWGGRADVIGSTLQLDRTSVEIIGILPSAVESLADADIWTAAPPDLQRAPRVAGFLGQVARLRDGVSLETAGAEFTAAAGRLAIVHPDTDRGRQVTLVPLSERLSQEARLPLLVLLGTVALVMIVACLNVAALTLARGLGRLRESTLRVALGAGRARLVQLHLVESGLLAGAGVALGLGLSVFGLDLLRVLLPPMPRIGEAAIDARLVAIAAGLGIGCALLVATVPALLSWRAAAAPTLREGGPAVSGFSRTRWRGILVVAEVAVAVVLLVGASLFARSLSTLQARPLGFVPERTLSFSVPLSWDTPGPRVAEVRTRVLERLQSAPDVVAAGVVDRLPLGGGSQTTPVIVRGVEIPKALAALDAGWRTASASYFRAVGLPLVRGELYDDAVGPGAPRTAVVNESFVRTYLRDRDPIGMEVAGYRSGGGEQPFYRIVGVVGDLRTELAEATPLPAVYVPMGRTYWPLLHFVARVRGEPAQLLPVVRALASDLAPEITIDRVQTLEEHVSAVAREPRTRTWIVTAFAGVALALAALGLYGLLAGEVAARLKEIGIRLTLGAAPHQVLAQTLARGLRLAGLGLAIGFVLAPLVGRALADLLPGISAGDWRALLVAFTVLLVIAALVSLGPAWRASRVDPNVVLRTE